MFRRFGMGSFKDLLIEISRDPAMVYFLDNCLSHKGAINENYGRELLELFSMGVGMDGEFNYTEQDVKECSRAFTGWTIANSIPNQPYGRYDARFVYNPYDHDDGGEDILGGDRKPSTAKTLSTLSSSSQPRHGSSPATCTATLLPMKRRCRLG